MNWLRKLLAYSLISLGVLSVALLLVVVPVDHETENDEVPTTLIVCLLMSAAISAGGIGLLRSSRSSQHKTKALELEAEQERLRGVLYQLIADKQGQFTLVQFALAADIPPKAAKDFLDQQATAFNANFNVSEQGAVVYQFPVS